MWSNALRDALCAKEAEQMITVFTPTYNRAYILPKLYASLRAQTSDNFEWVIVDDGSTDETKRLVTGWLSDKNKFCVRYYNRENGGKHRAINFGVQVARGELFFIVDSDDYLTPDAIETLILWEASIKNNDKFCGVAGEKASIRDGSIIGNPISSGEYIDATALEREYYNILGDKAEAFYTKLLKKYPFPEIDGENFITENVVWYRIAHDGYKMRWYKKPIYMCEYREDGLTHQGNTLFTRNPIGYALSVRERCEYRSVTVKEKILAAYYYHEDVKNDMSVLDAIRMLDFPYWLAIGVYAQKINVKVHGLMSIISQKRKKS